MPDNEPRDALRLYLIETAGVLIAHAECMQKYCSIRDDFGTMYSVRHIATYAKALIAGHNKLTDATKALIEAAADG